MGAVQVREGMSRDGFPDAIGAEVKGFSLAEKPSQAEVEQLHSALLDHSLLVFRATALSPEGLVRFARCFGELESFPPDPTQLAEYPEIVRLSNVEGLGYPTVGYHWHPDGHVRQNPTTLSLLYCVQPSRTGGETLFAGAHQAYETLPAVTKRRIEGVSGLRENGVAHPLVRMHPVTGRPALYVNAGRTAGLIGTESDRADELIAELVDHLEQVEGVYSHEWRAGDLVVWDNAAILHRATPASPDPRIVHRVEVRGEAA
jgi:taurine dioxygenase